MLCPMIIRRTLLACLIPTLAMGCGGGSDPGAATGGTGTGTGTSTNTSTSATSTSAGGSSTTGTSATTTGTSTTSTGTTGSTTNGAGGTGGGGTPTGPLPADESAASITAFLQSSGYTDASWLSIHQAPTPSEEGSVSPHGTVRVYMSPALVAARQANPNLNEAPTDQGVMAVKEMYDDAQALVGHAVLYYPQQGSVFYYCYGPAGRCSSESGEATMAAPEWGAPSASAVSSCRFCHGGNIFTELP